MAQLGSNRAYVRSLFVQRTATTGEAYANHVVKTFNDLRVFQDHPVLANPHAKSAQLREAGENAALALCKELGREPYLVQKSKRQAAEGLSGSNEIHWLKDVAVPIERFNPKPEQVIVMVNTDYYLQMHEILARKFQLTIIVGFTPTAVAKDHGEYTFTSASDGTYTYSVPGGEKPYVHKIWDYRGDALTVVSTECGMPWRIATYRVTRKALDDHHSITLLMPLNKWWGLPALYNMATLEKPNILERLSVAGVGTTTKLVVKNPGGQEMINVGFSGELLNCTLVHAHLQSLRRSAAANKTRHSRAAVEAFITATNFAQRAAETTCVYNWVLEDLSAITLAPGLARALSTKCSTVEVAKQGVNSYRFNLAGYDTAAKVGVIAFMPPFVDGAFAPTSERVNERAAVNGRLLRTQPEEMNLEGPDALELLEIADKFIALAVPKHMRQQMVWEDFQDVWDRQNRPAQRLQIERSGVEPPRSDVTSFVKGEAILKPGDPRLIHQQAPKVKIDYARVIGSVTKFCLKRCRWYAFGATPREIAGKLTEVLYYADDAILTDYSRFDGSVGNLIRDIEGRFLVALCHPSYVVETLKLHRMQYKQKSKSKHGVKYFTGYSRLSGSAETSAFNTFANALVAFAALMLSGQGFTPEEAWDRLGLYGGDDGVTPNVDAAHYVLVARRFGLKLKAEPVQRGQTGVTFLGRLYGPGVWYLDPNSMCDLERWLCRFHCTAKVDCKPLEKLLEKCRALDLTDHDTPYIREFLAMVKRLWGKDWPERHWDWRLWKWGSDHESRDQYPNTAEAWMEEAARAIAARLEFDEEVFFAWVASRTDINSVLDHKTVFAVSRQPSVDSTMVIGDEVVVPRGEGARDRHPLELEAPELNEPARQPVPPPTVDQQGHEEAKTETRDGDDLSTTEADTTEAHPVADSQPAAPDAAEAEAAPVPATAPTAPVLRRFTPAVDPRTALGNRDAPADAKVDGRVLPPTVRPTTEARPAPAEAKDARKGPNAKSKRAEKTPKPTADKAKGKEAKPAAASKSKAQKKSTGAKTSKATVANEAKPAAAPKPKAQKTSTGAKTSKAPPKNRDGVGENQYSQGKQVREAPRKGKPDASSDRPGKAKEAEAPRVMTANKAKAAAPADAAPGTQPGAATPNSDGGATTTPVEVPEARPRSRPARKCPRDEEGICPLGKACRFRHACSDTEGGKAYQMNFGSF